MKINWGTGIAIFYTLFASVLVMVVIKSKQYDHSLVVDNYYEEDLHYQSHFDKLVNSQQAGMAVQISLDKAKRWFVKLHAKTAAKCNIFRSWEFTS